MIQQTNQFYTSTWHFGVHNSYNERGQLIYKKLHGGIQSIDYKYNIRGWLTQINNPENFTKDGSGDTQADLYAMRLNYNTLETGVMTDSAKLRYGGDITSMIWNTSGKGKKSYGFAYDGLDRLKSSDYKVYSGSVWLDSTSFEERNINYDKNGNFLTLLRTREKGDTMNNFSYGYKGNQLDTLFNRKTGLKYLYDGNGNMTTDGLRGFNLQYNILNLPRSISKSTDTILYIYSATGEKLAKRMKDKTYQYYAGNMVYNTSRVFDYLLTEEGMVKYASGSFTYEYFLKDHLGNTRLAFKPNSGSSTVEQATEYYPFGATLGLIDPNVNSNKYLYNGKELQDDVLSSTALDWYDYGARFYDPQIGRWHTIDKLSEHPNQIELSPYEYAWNNPVNLDDPDGNCPMCVVAYYAYVGITAIAASVSTYIVTKNAVDHINDNRERYKEQQRRERASKRENSEIKQKHAESVNRNVGEPTPDGDGTPVGGGSAIAKVVIGTGLAAELIKGWNETTGGNKSNNSDGNNSTNNSKNSAENTKKQGDSSSTSSSAKNNDTKIPWLVPLPKPDDKNEKIVIPLRQSN